MNSWAGRTLGKVRIDSMLARGGMAEVYLGTHTTLQREVVVKILRGHYEDDPTLLERFQREARVVAKLRHPHIVQVFDFDTVDDQPYIVMEYIQGPSLSKYLKALHEKIGRLELPHVIRILTGVASALQYAHESGVIHRDVKPGNILLTSRSGEIVPGEPLPADFEPILTDFGLVRILSTSEQTTVGRIAGTPAYMSPEQARGEQTDERTDIYSLGIVLYQLLAGHVPFDGESTVSILLKQINEPPPPIAGLSAPLQHILDRALAKKVEDRFQTVKELASEFRAVTEEISEASTAVGAGTAARISSTKKTSDRARPRKRWLPAALTGIAILGIGAFSLLNGRSAFGTADTAPTASPTASASPTIETPIGLVASPLGPTGVLRFQDGPAIMDQAVLTAFAMPAPPAGGQYEVWLVSDDGEERRSLGILTLDETGRGELKYEDPQDQNLLALYNRVEVTIKSGTDANGEVPDEVAYAYTLPENGLAFVRRLLVSSALTPDRDALVQGLYASTRLLEGAAREMLRAHESGNERDVQEAAEAIVNLLVGRQSQEHKDWNDDGRVSDPGDGYGFWLNANSLGYIQAVYSHADYAANSPGASQNMISNGARVKACAENLAQWTPQLRARLSTVLNSEPDTDVDQTIHDAVTLADQILNGVDEDDSGEVEPVPGECGVLTAYEYAYYMADMVLLPVNPPDSPTTTGTPSPTNTSSSFIRPTNTPTRSPGTSFDTPVPGSTSVQQPNTPVPPTDNPLPTDPPPDNPPGNPPQRPPSKTPKPDPPNKP